MDHLYIRKILEAIENLEESTGLAGRKRGEIFKNMQTGDEIVFQGLIFLPQAGGKLSPEELDAEIEANSDVRWMNNKSAKTGGLAIAEFTDSTGNIMRVGQYLEKVNPNFTDNYVSNKIFDYTLQTKASVKTQEKLKAQDLLDKKENLTIANIMNQLAVSLGTDSHLYHVAHKLATNTPLPYKFPAPPGVSFTGFRDYFCEILHPIALQVGRFTGNGDEAARRFLNGSFKDTLITFDESVTAGLSDSLLTTKDGKKQLAVSSKGGKGAKASAKNLFDKVKTLEETQAGRELIKDYAEEVDILRNIVSQGQNGSPLYLGVKFDIINEAEAKQIQYLRGNAPVNLNDEAEIKKLNLTSRLKTLIKGRVTKTPEATNLYYHLIAAVAFKAADKVNDSTNFSKAAVTILNNGAFIQVYTVAKESKNEWSLDEFNAVYPSETIKGVYLSAAKTYSSKQIKGNFTFLIDKGQGVPTEQSDDDVGEPAPAKTSVSKKQAAANMADILTGKKSKNDSDDTSVSVNVGRKKRK